MSYSNYSFLEESGLFGLEVGVPVQTASLPSMCSCSDAFLGRVPLKQNAPVAHQSLSHVHSSCFSFTLENPCAVQETVNMQSLLGRGG